MRLWAEGVTSPSLEGWLRRLHRGFARLPVGKEVLPRRRNKWMRKTRMEPFPAEMDRLFEPVGDMALMAVSAVATDCGGIVWSEAKIVAAGSMGGRGYIDRLG